MLSCNEQSSQGEAFLQEVDQNAAGEVYDLELEYKGPKPTAFEAFPTGQVRPEGWILEMMNNDLEQGIVGHLDELYPGISKDDLYGSARRGGVEDVPEMGDLVLTGAAWETSIMWWNAETIGNWWDGFVRHAFLADNQSAMEQAIAIVNGLLDSQDEDGYLGIYKENLRYRHKGSNGELWAQTTAFRTLLGYYEITGELRVLTAVERAMELTMKEYGPEGRNPFDLEVNFESAPTVKDFKGRKYLTYGPLVYAKDIPAQRENIKSYALEGFHDYYCTPSTQYKERELLATSAVQQAEGENYPLLLVKTAREGVVAMDTLIPFGQTTLRQTTFTQRQ